MIRFWWRSHYTKFVVFARWQHFSLRRFVLSQRWLSGWLISSVEQKLNMCVCSHVRKGRVPSVAPAKMAVNGVPAQLQFGGDSALQSAYGVLPDINHRHAGQSASQPSNFALSVISAPAPIASRQTEHSPTCHNHHFRPTADDSSLRGQRAPQFHGR